MKNENEFYNAFRFDESYSLQLLVKKLICVAIDENNLKFTSDFTGTIDSSKYQIYFGILPTGDFVYYTINKKSKIKGNYSRITKLRAIYGRLTKLGVISPKITIEEIIASDSELKELLYIDNIDANEGFVGLAMDMAMNVEYPFMEGSATIEYTDEQFEHLKVGSIWFKIYNSYHLSSEELRYAADSVSGDDLYLMNSFIKEYDDEISFGLKFLTLDRIKIEPKYRNKGIGRQAIKELIKVCEILDIQYIVLQPAPIENVDFSEENKNIRKRQISKLVKYYEKLGFIKYQHKGKEPFMVLEVEEFL